MRKKIISTLIAATMLIGMIPTVLAVDITGTITKDTVNSYDDVYTSSISGSTVAITSGMAFGDQIPNSGDTATLWTKINTLNGNVDGPLNLDGETRVLGYFVEVPVTTVDATLTYAYNDNTTATKEAYFTFDASNKKALMTGAELTSASETPIDIAVYFTAFTGGKGNTWVVDSKTKSATIEFFSDAGKQTSLGTQTINFNATYATPPSVEAKSIEFGYTPIDGQQADESAELAGTFGFTVNDENNVTTVTGATTQKKITDNNTAFVTYYTVNDLVKSDVDNIRVSRDSVKLYEEPIDSGANSPEDIGGNLHFKLGTTFITGSSGSYALRFTRPYTEKVELLKGDKIVAVVTYTVDFSGASIMPPVVENGNVDIIPPTIGSGVVRGDIPTNVVIPDETQTLTDIKAATGIVDDQGNPVIATNVTKVELKVDGIDTGSTNVDVVADKNKIRSAVSALVSPTSAFLDIKVELTDGNGAKNIRTLGNSSIEIIIDIPSNLLGREQYQVWSVHNGVVSNLKATKVGNTLKFNMNKFSTVGIVAGGNIVTPPPTIPNTPNYPFYGGFVGGWGGTSANYAFNFQTNGGTNMSSVFFNRGEIINIKETPIKSGFVFGGWYLDEALTKPLLPNTRAENNVTLYARWLSETALTVDNIVPVIPTTSTDVPQTGDNTAPIILPIVIAGLAVIVLVKRRKTNKI